MSVSDLKPGVIKECQICRSKKIYEILDLGHSGLCDSLLTKNDLNKFEKSYPLKLLKCRNCHLLQINYVVDNKEVDHTLTMSKLNDLADKSSVRCLDKDAEERMINVIDEAKSNGDSVGGSFEVIAKGMPYGLGSYINADGKLQARISQAMMSVNAFKGVEVGAGFASSAAFGSELHDEILFENEKITRSRNNAGGIEGGMSNAQPIHVKVSMKPISTLIKPLRSIDLNTMEPKLAHKERTDSCAVPAASIIGESMLAIVLADALLEKFGGDSIKQLKKHIESSGKY